MKNNRAYLLRTEITKSHLNNHIYQHRGMKTSRVTPSFYYVFNISLYCNDTIPSFIGNLWWVLLLGNHLKAGFHLKAVFTSLNVAFLPISHSRFKQPQVPPLRTSTNVLRFCVNFWVIFGHFVNLRFFLKG